MEKGRMFTDRLESSSEEAHMRSLLKGVAVALVVVGLVRLYPDIARYVRMVNM